MQARSASGHASPKALEWAWPHHGRPLVYIPGAGMDSRWDGSLRAMLARQVLNHCSRHSGFRQKSFPGEVLLPALGTEHLQH